LRFRNPTRKSPKKKPDKPKSAAGKKSPIIFIVIAVVVIAIIAGIVVAISNHQKVLAELPDPEYFYSAAGIDIDEVVEKKDIKRVILRSDEDLWKEVAAYVDLLKWSGKYPVTQSDEELYSSGDYMWNFVYNNRGDIKSPYFAQVEINYYNKSNGRDVYAVWIIIHDTDAFDLVEREQYEEPTPTETTPSDDFSGVGGDGNDPASDSNSVTESPSVNDSVSDWESDDDEDDDFEVHDAADIYDNPTPCGVCNRSGDCGTCGGDGYLHSSASDEEDRNCYSCSGRKIPQRRTSSRFKVF